MKLSPEILERVERVREFHESTKQLGEETSSSGSSPAKPHTVFAGLGGAAESIQNAMNALAGKQPSPYRVFEGYDKTPLPTKLVSPTVPTIALLFDGVEALPESHVQPNQDLRTLAAWLHLAAGVTRPAAPAKPGGAAPMLRAVPSQDLIYPCEIYVAAFGIEGLEPGLYHFSIQEFALRKLREGWETLAQLKRGRPDLEFLRSVPAVLLVSTVFCRSTSRLRKRGYRQALAEAGHVMENLSVVGSGLGFNTLVRMSVNAATTRELIGLPPDAPYSDSESVQGMVIWANEAAEPLQPPAGYTLPAPGTMPTLPRPAPVEEIVEYGSVTAVQEDCVAPGVAVREVRPPLTELSPLSQEFDVEQFPHVDESEGGTLLGRLLLNYGPATSFASGSLARGRVWTLNRIAFCWPSSYPLFPEGAHVALVRPFWIINGVSGIDPGLWYYYPKSDAWTALRRGNFRAEAQRVMMGLPQFASAAAICFMYANLYRLLTEAGPDLYRLAHLEAGAAAQRMYLGAGAYGLGCSLRSTFLDNDVRQLFGLERTGWEPIYAVAIGNAETKPAPAQTQTAIPEARKNSSRGLWRG